MSRRSSPLRRLEDRYERATSGPVAYRARDDELQDSFFNRVVNPLVNRGGRMITKKEQNDFAALLSRAGYPGGMTVRQLAGIRMLMVAGFALIAVLLTLALRSTAFLKDAIPIWMVGIAALAGALMGYVALPFILRQMVNKRKKMVQRTLPDVLDLITIAVEAGLGFDAAMDRVGQRYPGAMGEELLRTNNEIRMGRPWNDAMKDMAERTGVEDVQSLVTALIQAKELGVNLGNVLRAQSLRLREERARRAREQAQKAPTKMMIPLVLFIFPTLFIVLMGPAALRAIKTLQESDMPGLGGKKGK